MTAKATDRVTANRDTGKLRNQLFLSSALLASALLGIAAWVINSQVIGQVRQQVQAEVETLLPLYDAVWEEHARRLATLGTTMIDSPIVKEIFGSQAASHDQRTLHEMVADVSGENIKSGDLFLAADGAGQVFYLEQWGVSPEANRLPEIRQLEAARAAGERQQQSHGFTMIGNRLFQLALTPLVTHSGSADFNNTMAVIGTGEEVNRAMAAEIKLRMHSEIVFLVAGKLHASSLARESEAAAFQAIRAGDFSQSSSGRPVEINLDGELYLVFAKQLTDFDGKPIGQVFVMRSLAEAGKLFHAISNRLLVLWTLAILAALALSYLIAGRITRPLEKLVVSAKELGRGNYDVVVPTGAQGEVAQLATAFDQMRHSLRQTQAALLKNERLATIGQMASSIIHDLRNPLATISTAAEVMRNDGLSVARRQTMIETQLRASTRMNSMLGELLEFSRGSYKLNPHRLSLAAIVQRALQELSVQISQLGVELHTDVPEEIMLDADEEKLGRVFENLLINSLQAFQQAGQQTGAIQILARRETEFIRVELIDDGPGIPASIRERLFEPFISVGKIGGTGLGLAIARGIVEAHGGKISLVDSETGAHFVIQLPFELSAGRRE
ncbi:MAG: HAMP domain-containing histidine kinase [Acidobacteria bacterium]|nr:HAMP domain-containing histidine kinase [Acidobacteriota bacterium]